MIVDCCDLTKQNISKAESAIEYSIQAKIIILTTICFLPLYCLLLRKKETSATQYKNYM